VHVSDGELDASDVQAIVVRNVPPHVDAGPVRSGPWGIPIRFAGTVTDPSAADTKAGLAPRWSFGDGTGAAGADVAHAYAAPGAYTATLSATDKDGGTASAAAAVTATKRATSLAYTGSTTIPFGFATLVAALADAVDPATAQLAGRSVTFTVDGRSVTATTDARGVASV
jgi:hypothetical protein